ncbi:AimR family lysis-lysogeny pheromone receptor [Halobacillus litoralis]|uniref:AimR family lysis-lysogeny pheromone receptor n=1 Tax=Halobacillus litoralis TaxID=45668 RepID=UPI001CD690B2|nr:AimR family lysis-lysogeny pheromone receptor [Halobacillus litoralis]MCA1021591.1 AimR family lysis-lysogeny pheromone receptor [Halobacillus litoralis]
MSNLVLNEIEMKGWKAEVLAKEIGMPKGTFSKIVNQAATPELRNVLKVVRHIIPHKEKEYMEQYLPSLTTPDRIIEGIEYASTNRMFPQFQMLLDLMENGKSRKLKLYAVSYKLLYTFQKNYHAIDHTFYRNVVSVNKDVLDDEQGMMVDIAEAYFHYKNKDYKTFCVIAQSIKEQIQNIKEGYFKESVTVRLHQMLANVNLLYKCDYDQAVECAEILITSSIGKTYTAYGYYVKAMAALSSNYNEAQKNIDLAIKNYKQASHFDAVKTMKRKMIQIKSFWNKPIEETDDYSKVYKNLSNGAVKEQMVQLSKTAITDPCEKIYIQGVLKGDDTLLLAAMTNYVKEGNYFHSLFPKQALLNRGKSVEAVELFYNIG